MKNQTAVIGLVAMFFAAPLLAQSQTPGIDKRIDKQERRIEQGEASGQLTNREAARLERREAKLRADTARAQADGQVTPRERRRLNREANRDSRAVYRKKHNARSGAAG